MAAGERSAIYLAAVGILLGALVALFLPRKRKI
ncbi:MULTISPECIES: LPXTG cell wall anchor domain-containing protein [Paenibacillus]|uniref:LPXTG cell wall anchor domain-containing protein n=1 Tax=Paenibacillus vulneris TaxID=1133364 RepID=A0ABW3UXE3_9BACL